MRHEVKSVTIASGQTNSSGFTIEEWALFIGLEIPSMDNGIISAEMEDADGNYQIIDHGSTAGTWINYQQITSPDPQFLKDGDIIHIGEAVFRFQKMEATEPPQNSKENG